jgi:hypothetical protein
MADVIQLRPVLTIKAMDEASWEPALSYVLPEHPDIELLDRARSGVLTYLEFVTHHVTHGDNARADMMRAAHRLIEIAELWAAALDADETAKLEADNQMLNTGPAPTPQ